jgi:hypothetical protein
MLGRPALAWPCAAFLSPGADHFPQLASLDAELIIFGSGVRLRFPRPAWLQPLMARRIGVETMDTPAACRTYNILAGEGRNVVAALLLEQRGPEARFQGKMRVAALFSAVKSAVSTTKFTSLPHFPTTSS